ncbi:hypothetical protein BAE44_0011721, partial [Dichanthelium oligosanthes]
LSTCAVVGPSRGHTKPLALPLPPAAGRRRHAPPPKTSPSPPPIRLHHTPLPPERPPVHRRRGLLFPGHFAAEDYLVTTCGLAREKAAKAAKSFSHWKSPANADAVLVFLTGPELGLSKADITLLVTKDPRILNCSVDNTLRARVDGFHRHGFSEAQIRGAPCTFRTFNIDEKLGFWMSFMGSPDKFLRIIKCNFYLVTSDIDRVIKTNIRLLQEGGLSVQDINHMCVVNPNSPDLTRAILVRAEELGVPRDSLMFRHMVNTVAGLRPETIASKFKMIGKTLACSDAEGQQGRDPDVQRGAPVGTPELCDEVAQGVKEKGWIRKDLSFYSMVTVGEKKFYSKYIDPHKDVLPGLANAYASACKGKITT